jgi:F0F1-type ATP synthase assembly protein I
LAEEGTKKSNRKAIGGILIPAGLMIGMGIGFLTDNLVPWMFIGLGAGFLGFFLVVLLVRD